MRMNMPSKKQNKPKDVDNVKDVKPRPVEVTFHDPATETGWRDVEYVYRSRSGACQVIGYLVPSEDKDLTTLVMGFALNGQLLNYLVIPKSLIRKIRRLR